MNSALLSPQAALERLQAGNARFARGACEHPHLGDDRRRVTCRDGQQPFATILACSDSRVPVELIFDVGVGDLFVIRVAGNVCNTDEAGSIEYGVDHLETPLCVILGHSHCGAVTAVATNARLDGCIARLTAPISDAVRRARAEAPELEGDALIAKAVELNIWHAREQLLRHSAATARRIEQGGLMAVGAHYDLETGIVSWLGEGRPTSEAR